MIIFNPRLNLEEMGDHFSWFTSYTSSQISLVLPCNGSQWFIFPLWALKLPLMQAAPLCHSIVLSACYRNGLHVLILIKLNCQNWFNTNSNVGLYTVYQINLTKTNAVYYESSMREAYHVLFGGCTCVGVGTWCWEAFQILTEISEPWTKDIACLWLFTCTNIMRILGVSSVRYTAGGKLSLPQKK